MLNRDQDTIGVDDRAAGLATLGHGQELLGLPASIAVQGDREQPVVAVECVAVRGDPQIAMGIERDVVGAGDRTDLGLVEPAVVGVGSSRVAAHQQEFPGELGAGVVVGHLQDLAVLVLVAGVHRIGRRFSIGAAIVVVRQRAVDLAGLRIRFDVLGPVHLGRAHGVGGLPGEHRDLGGGHAGDVRACRTVGIDRQQRLPGPLAGEFP